MPREGWDEAMADYLTASPKCPSCNYTETRFLFNTTSILSLDSGRKMSMETLSPISPLGFLKDHHHNVNFAPDLVKGNGIIAASTTTTAAMIANDNKTGGGVSNNNNPCNLTINKSVSNHGDSRALLSSTSSFGGVSHDSHSSISDNSSVNSVFYKAKSPSSPTGLTITDYVREPLKVPPANGKPPLPLPAISTNGNTIPRLYPGSAPNNYNQNIVQQYQQQQQLQYQPQKFNQPENGSLTGTPTKSKLANSKQEVTYTIHDELEENANQVVFLPPPPEDLDSDCDSVGRCDIGGTCSPRHRGTACRAGRDASGTAWRRSSREFSKSSGGGGAGGSSRCLCCMLLVFILSSAGLSSVLVLMYLGKLQLKPVPTVREYKSEGRPQLGDGALLREVCEEPGCLKTSSSILARMNTSINPCQDFYTYACGGYQKTVDLSWFNTRVRESPDEIIQEHRKLIIDRLSASFNPRDERLVGAAKEIFRSCLLKPKDNNDRIKAAVSEILENLGGINAATDTNDMTMLLANVTRMFGASPFFKFFVHPDTSISLISHASNYDHPWLTAPDYSRSRHTGSDQLTNREKLMKLLRTLIEPSLNGSDASAMVNNFLSLQMDIKRVLNTERRSMGNRYNSIEDITCDPVNHRKNIGELQVKFSGFGIDWFQYFQNVMETVESSDLKFCKVKLSLDLQAVLNVTPKKTIRQFIILHTLLHSDLFMLFHHDDQGAIPNVRRGEVDRHEDISHNGDINPAMFESREEQCLDILLYFLPSLETYVDCDERAVAEGRNEAMSTLRSLRSALQNVLATTPFSVPAANAASVTNSTVSPVVNAIERTLTARCPSGSGPKGPFDEYSFTTNMVRLVQYHHGEYFKGKMRPRSRDGSLLSLWISANSQGEQRSRAGPILYPAPVPQPVVFGSLGSFLASKVADRLGIENILEYHGNGLFNHTTVLGLAVRLKCLNEMYSEMELLKYEDQVYKVNGIKTKEQQWKNQIALKMAFKAWQHSDRQMDIDHFIPGLHAFTKEQLFFISYAQTHCEKVSERGILQYYVSDKVDPGIPSHQRVNGILRSMDEFSDAFLCSDNAYMNPMEKCRIFG